ncbi:glycosyltransferase [Aminipila terrae]|uniref:Glycosyltransferase n=1 Tax=Aminipila terrae TaxID=2697030 RepID=A0A6P1MBQ8_9FIRM|nr:glycosyltransferase [Aminipila terrae]QHI72070.1 glycosyltransferase [Aminipila terrae]
MKKILYVASSYGHILSFHIPYIRELHEMGFQVHVAAAGAFENTESLDIPKIPVPFEKKMLSPRNAACTLQLIKLIKKERYDIISVHTTLAAFYVRMAVMLIRGTKPKVINTVHGYLFDYNTPILKRSILLWAEKLTRPATDILVVMNQQDYEIAEKNHLYKDQLFKIPGFGIDTERFSKKKVEEKLLLFYKINNGNKNVMAANDMKAIRRTERLKFGIEENDTVLIYAAEFSKRKNQKMLIEAMMKLPQNVKLLLAGRGERLEECQRLSEQLKLNSEATEGMNSEYRNRILFLGHVKNLEDYYYISDICVSASRIEGLPFNIMEAMSMGLPIVATNVKGHQDLIEPGINGYLFQFNDINGFKDIIYHLLSEKTSKSFGGTNVTQEFPKQVQEKYVNMSENNINKVQQYKLDDVIENIINIYKIENEI